MLAGGIEGMKNAKEMGAEEELLRINQQARNKAKNHPHYHRRRPPLRRTFLRSA
jgi:hypothetical protein